MDWQKARILEGYLTALEQQAENESDDQKRAAMLRKIAWGKEKLAWLDPLISRPDPILGKRQHQLPEDKKVDIEQPRTPTWFGGNVDFFDDDEEWEEEDDGLPW